MVAFRFLTSPSIAELSLGDRGSTAAQGPPTGGASPQNFHFSFIINQLAGKIPEQLAFHLTIISKGASLKDLNLQHFRRIHMKMVKEAVRPSKTLQEMKLLRLEELKNQVKTGLGLGSKHGLKTEVQWASLTGPTTGSAPRRLTSSDVGIDLKSEDLYLPHADNTLDMYNKQFISRVYQYFLKVSICLSLATITSSR
ncbi:hypothetical protein RND71_039803 [Anisodus tanguticus]|uniref:Uncharacterized protein n=1 Tax=Anisodus tanguticus TaxID=243964 RepID=A0AAE1USB8_9SOLA|nr:hypothetical protein RND71_039803 [Anisodus tanguticus]